MFVYNLARNRISRTVRATRSGRRKTGFILPNGLRIRKMGKRGIQITLEDARKMAEAILLGVRDCYIGVKDDNGKPYSMEELEGILYSSPKKAPKEPVPELAEEEKALPAEEEPKIPDPVVVDEESLQKMKRSELDELAVNRGLDPAEYKNKGEIVAALLNEEE